VINRQEGLTVEWSAPNSGAPVRVTGTSESSLNAQNNENGVFVCTAAAEAGRLTVPPEVLANLPPSSDAGGVSTGALYIGATAGPVDGGLSAPGINLGITGSIHYVGRLVRYQ
jgi:hypothetical protein